MNFCRKIVLVAILAVGVVVTGTIIAIAVLMLPAND